MCVVSGLGCVLMRVCVWVCGWVGVGRGTEVGVWFFWNDVSKVWGHEVAAERFVSTPHPENKPRLTGVPWRPRARGTTARRCRRDASGLLRAT